jgi:hypothetical protein
VMKGLHSAFCVSYAVCLAAMVSLVLVGSASAQTGGLDIRGGVTGYLSQRSAVLQGEAGRGSGTLAGIELSARSRLVGGSVRLFGGSFSADVGDAAVGDIGRADISVVAGPESVAAELGYALRTFTGAFGTRRWSFVRLGGQAVLPLGSTGLDASVSAAVYLGVSGSHDTGKGSGRDLETRLTYTATVIPLYFGLGYRLERFIAADASESRPEEMSGVVVVAGVRLRM